MPSPTYNTTWEHTGANGYGVERCIQPQGQQKGIKTMKEDSFTL